MKFLAFAFNSQRNSSTLFTLMWNYSTRASEYEMNTTFAWFSSSRVGRSSDCNFSFCYRLHPTCTLIWTQITTRSIWNKLNCPGKLRGQKKTANVPDQANLQSSDSRFPQILILCFSVVRREGQYTRITRNKIEIATE